MAKNKVAPFSGHGVHTHTLTHTHTKTDAAKAIPAQAASHSLADLKIDTGYYIGYHRFSEAALNDQL